MKGLSSTLLGLERNKQAKVSFVWQPFLLLWRFMELYIHPLVHAFFLGPTLSNHCAIQTLIPVAQQPFSCYKS